MCVRRKEGEREGERERETDRQTDRQTYRQTDTNVTDRRQEVMGTHRYLGSE